LKFTPGSAESSRETKINTGIRKAQKELDRTRIYGKRGGQGVSLLWEVVERRMKGKRPTGRPRVKILTGLIRNEHYSVIKRRA